jgi:hypothetical protein
MIWIMIIVIKKGAWGIRLAQLEGTANTVTGSSKRFDFIGMSLTVLPLFS